MTRHTPFPRLATGLLAILCLLLTVYGNHVMFAGSAPTAETTALPTHGWGRVNIGLEDPHAMQFSDAFAADGRIDAFFDHNTLFLGYGYGAIHRSDTRGRSWSLYGTLPPVFKLTAVSPQTPAGPVLLGVEEYFNPDDGAWYYRLLRSTSAAGGWTTVWDRSPLFNQIVFSPNFAADGVVFVVWANSPSGGIWKSTDGGVTWRPDQKIAVHPHNGRVVSLAFSPNFAADRTLIASVPAYWDGSITWPGGVHRSTDGGATWFLSDAGCVGRVWKLVFSPNFAADQTVYAAGEDSSDPDNYRVYRSTNGGGVWECLPVQPAAGQIDDIALSPAFANDRTVLLGTAVKGLMRSTDGGASWRTVAWNGSGVLYVYFSPNYAQDHMLAVALRGARYHHDGPGGNFFSDDNGATWRSANIYPAPVQALALSNVYTADRSLWAGLGAGQGNLYRSADGGNTWRTQMGFILYDPSFNSIAAFHPTGSAPVVFATAPTAPFVGGGVYVSLDGGVSYQRTSGPLYGNQVIVSPAYAADHTVWVAAYNGLYQSTDAGASWGLVTGGLPAANVSSVAVSPAYAVDRTLFAVLPDGAHAGVYRTADAGAHWTKLTLPGGAAPAHTALSPAFAADQTVWVSSLADGVLRSADRGATWQASTTVLANCGPVAPMQTAAAGRTLWAACGGTAYRSADEGATWTADSPAGATVTHAVAYPDGETVFLGTSERGIYRRERIYTVLLPVALKP